MRKMLQKDKFWMAFLCPNILLWLDLLVISSDGDLVNRLISYVNATFQVLLEFTFSCLELILFQWNINFKYLNIIY